MTDDHCKSTKSRFSRFKDRLRGIWILIQGVLALAIGVCLRLFAEHDVLREIGGLAIGFGVLYILSMLIHLRCWRYPRYRKFVYFLYPGAKWR